MLVGNVLRVRRRLQDLWYQRQCRAQGDPLVERDGLIVTICYDVEGDYARRGATPSEIESVGRLLDIERRYAIRSTYNIVARFALDAPRLVAAIRAAGNEIASHSYDHSVLTRLSTAEIVENLQKTQRAFDSLGVETCGHRCPQSDWDRRVLDTLVTCGYRWSAENGSESHPYRIRLHGRNTLWRFPVAGDDWRYESEGISPGIMLEQLRKQVLEAFGRRKHLAIGFHPWVEAAPGRLTALEEFFHWLVEQKGVVVMPFGDVLRMLDESEERASAVAPG